MKYLPLILAIIFFSCSTDSSQNTDTTESDEAPAIAASEEHSDDEDELHEESANAEEVVKTETIVIRDSDINVDAEVKTAFLNIVEAVNSATGDNAALAMSFLDKDYAFKGNDRKASIARLEKQFAAFKSDITDVEIKQLNSSCNLAYLIASFKRTITDRATGDVKVETRDKVGLFIFRKNSAGVWKLLVQKTDDGRPHWFYMPDVKS